MKFFRSGETYSTKEMVKHISHAPLLYLGLGTMGSVFFADAQVVPSGYPKIFMYSGVAFFYLILLAHWIVTRKIFLPELKRRLEFYEQSQPCASNHSPEIDA